MALLETIAHISQDSLVWDWPSFSQRFIEGLGLSFNSHTTQIEAHDGIAAFFGDIQRSNCVIKDLCQDMWLYISLNYFTLPNKPKEVGSSTMPHKVNPIDFENAEGNIGIANAVLGHLSEKLTISRLQRDLSDSTAIRNVGVGIGHSLIACHSTSRGLEKIVPNPKQMAQELDQNWQVLAEAIVSAMKAHGTVDAYEQLKKTTRGKGSMSASIIHAAILSAALPKEVEKRLLDMRPADYIGLASELARRF